MWKKLKEKKRKGDEDEEMEKKKEEEEEDEKKEEEEEEREVWGSVKIDFYVVNYLITYIFGSNRIFTPYKGEFVH